LDAPSLVVTVTAGLMMLVGLIGIVVPMLPGLLLVWAAVLLWAFEAQSPAGWLVLGFASILALVGFVVQILVPGRRLRAAGVTTSATVTGTVLGFLGLFVIPVVGAFVGFLLGVYLSERVKLGSHAAAWPSTKHALRAIGLTMGIELLTGLAIGGAWVIGVVATT
jgi:uncharacterized protein YqgC (DUF456 family)